MQVRHLPQGQCLSPPGLLLSPGWTHSPTTERSPMPCPLLSLCFVPAFPQLVLVFYSGSLASISSLSPLLHSPCLSLPIISITAAQLLPILIFLPCEQFIFFLVLHFGNSLKDFFLFCFIFCFFKFCCCFYFWCLNF